MTRQATDPELVAMQLAYLALSQLPPRQWTTALAWLEMRLRSDQRTASAAAAGGIDPEKWVLSGSLECSDEGPIAVALEYAECGEVTEIDGIAVVRRHFAVRYETDEGSQIEMFDTRADAEAFVVSMEHEAAVPRIADEAMAASDA